MAEITWITKELACAIHDRQLAVHGGMAGIRDECLLSSARARPQNVFAYTNPKPNFARLAAAYAHGLVKNHAFVDGNKRTAHVVYRTFLSINDVVLSPTQTEKLDAMIQPAEGSLTEEQFAEWIQQNIQSQ